MTIQINYLGRLGNNMFQYAFAAIVIKAYNDHKKNNIFNIKSLPTTNQLKCLINSKFKFEDKISNLESETSIENKFYTFTDYGINEGKILSIEDIFSIPYTKNLSFYFDGFFQHKSYYEGKRDFLKNLFIEPKYNINDTAIHIRLTDYKEINWTLPKSYYDDCIEKANPTNLNVFTDDPQASYILELKNRGANIIYGDPVEDLMLMASHKKIIISRSSYSWWGAILSNATSIYYPKPSKSFWSEEIPYKDVAIIDQSFVFVNC